MIGPVYFNMYKPKTFLMEHHIVMTLRRPRGTGETIAVTGSYYKHEEFAKVTVELELENVTEPEQLVKYVSLSGFEPTGVDFWFAPYEERCKRRLEIAKSWLKAAQEASGSQLNLYRVKIIELIK